MRCLLVASAVLDGQLSMRAVELDSHLNASTPQRAIMMLSAGTCIHCLPASSLRRCSIRTLFLSWHEPAFTGRDITRCCLQDAVSTEAWSRSWLQRAVIMLIGVVTDDGCVVRTKR